MVFIQGFLLKIFIFLINNYNWVSRTDNTKIYSTFAKHATHDVEKT